MSTTELPTHIGGYQHLEPDVVSSRDDIMVRDGCVIRFCESWAPAKVGHIEAQSGSRVYRKYPCPRQEGQRPLAVEEAAQLDAVNNIREDIPQKVREIMTALPTDAKARKSIPIYSGFLKYFPLAVAYVAQVSKRGNDQHNPGQPLHWDRAKSGDELDAAARHLLEAGSFDSDGVRHSGKNAWRSMANLQKELEEAERKGEPWFQEKAK